MYNRLLIMVCSTLAEYVQACLSSPFLSLFLCPRTGAVRILGVLMDFDFRFNKPISAVVQKSFFQLRQIEKLKPVLTWQDFLLLSRLVWMLR